MKTLQLNLALTLTLSLFAAATLVAGCAQTDHQNDKPVVDTAGGKDSTLSMSRFAIFGDTISPANAKDAGAVIPALAKTKEAPMKIKGKVHSVCQAKGCWMKIALPSGELMHVTFANYSFFVPRDITGKEVIVEGLAERDTMSVDDLRHYAEDANKSEKEIAAITEPKLTYKFDATGVLVAK